MELPPESATMIGDIITQNPDVSDDAINQMTEAGSLPKFPVVENPGEKNPDNLKIKPKMVINDMEDGATLTVTPEDLEGTFDYIPDVKSMAMGSDAQQMQAREEAVQLATTNTNVIQLLAQEGYKLKIKDLLVANYEDKGFRDAEKYFEKLPPNPAMGGVGPNMQQPGVPGSPQANPNGGPAQPMAGPGPVGQGGMPSISQPQGIPQGIR
jgi:hypothetical protein